MKKNLIIEIPGEILQSIKLPEEEADKRILHELALTLYERGLLSSGKAREPAGLTRWEFEDLLSRYKIFRHYTEYDLNEDINYADSCM